MSASGDTLTEIQTDTQAFDQLSVLGASGITAESIGFPYGTSTGYAPICRIGPDGRFQNVALTRDESADC